jgi:hypothetical protein
MNSRGFLFYKTLSFRTSDSEEKSCWICKVSHFAYRIRLAVGCSYKIFLRPTAPSLPAAHRNDMG